MLKAFGRITAVVVALSLVSAANGAFTVWFQDAGGGNLYASSAAALGDLTAVPGVNADVTLASPGSGWLQVWGINTDASNFITSWGHDVNHSGTAGVSAASYNILNPTVDKAGTVFRWENSAATTSGTLGGGSTIVSGANAVAVSAANGVKNGQTDTYSDGSDTNNVAYLLAVLEVSASSVGVSELRFAVGAGKITGAGTSAPGSVHFGWTGAEGGSGDPLVGDANGGSTVGATSAVADATITVVPEPVTLALLGLGGLALIRRRKVA